MYGGYETRQPLASSATRFPIRVDEPAEPSACGKYTTAWDLARLARAVHLAAGGKGPLPSPRRLRVAEARYLLWLLAHVADGGKLGRFLAASGGGRCTRQAGTATSRHDAGLVFWPGGVYVAAVHDVECAAASARRRTSSPGHVADAAFERFRSRRLVRVRDGEPEHA